MSQPVKTNLFIWSDLAFIGVCIFTLVGAIGGTATKSNPLVGIVLLWAVVVGCIAITTVMYVLRYFQLKFLHYTDMGLIVAWKNPAYAVKDTDFEVQVNVMLAKITLKYPAAQAALNGCVVFFTDATFMSWTPGYAVRKVAGIQDNASIVVGWHQDLSVSALQHELGHRVLQICAGDPPEDAAHQILASLGL